eukprot:14961624-Alexandrium_andersonii.AAC.1
MQDNGAPGRKLGGVVGKTSAKLLLLAGERWDAGGVCNPPRTHEQSKGHRGLGRSVEVPDERKGWPAKGFELKDSLSEQGL